MLVFEEIRKPEYPEKTSRSRVENQQQTQPTYDAGSGNRAEDTLVGGERSHHCAIPAPHCCVTALLFYYCLTLVLPLYYRCVTAVVILCHCCFTTVSLLSYYCVTVVLILCYFCFCCVTTVLLLS